VDQLFVIPYVESSYWNFIDRNMGRSKLCFPVAVVSWLSAEMTDIAVPCTSRHMVDKLFHCTVALQCYCMC